MFGDLDRPPLVIRRSRVKAMLMTAVGLLLFVGGVVQFNDADGRHAVWPAVGVLFGIASLF